MTGLPRSVADALHSVTHSQRALAYLQIDEELKLIGAGGNLENYGLGAVQLGGQAFDQAVFLDGLLPLPETPYLLPSVELAGGRAADLHFYQHDDSVWVVLLDVTAELGACLRGIRRAPNLPQAYNDPRINLVGAARRVR
jgi:hypothetical protein